MTEEEKAVITYAQIWASGKNLISAKENLLKVIKILNVSREKQINRLKEAVIACAKQRVFAWRGDIRNTKQDTLEQLADSVDELIEAEIEREKCSQ